MRIFYKLPKRLRDKAQTVRVKMRYGRAVDCFVRKVLTESSGSVNHSVKATKEHYPKIYREAKRFHRGEGRG